MDCTFRFESFPTLTTQRLLLREPIAADASDILIFRSDPEVQQYNIETIDELYEAQALIEEIHFEYSAWSRITWAVTLQNRPAVIGLVSLHNLDVAHARAELGYDLARSVWGQGIGQEAARAVLRFGFTEMGLHRIEATTLVENVRSIRLLATIGFCFEGVRREAILDSDGIYHNSAMYGLLQSEWP